MKAKKVKRSYTTYIFISAIIAVMLFTYFANKNKSVQLSALKSAAFLNDSRKENETVFQATIEKSVTAKTIENDLAFSLKNFIELLPHDDEKVITKAILNSTSILHEDPFIITRSQFRDVVMKKMPSALPTDSLNESVLALDLSSLPMDVDLLTENLNETRIVWDSLCAASQIQVNPHWKRTSFVLQLSARSIRCAADRFKEWLPNLHNLREVSIVFLDEKKGPAFGVINNNKQTFHIQTWKPNWIEKVTAQWDEESELNPLQVRSRRFAQLVRPLVYLSDTILRYEGSPNKVFGHLLIQSKESTKKGIWAEKSESSKNKKIGPLRFETNSNERTFLISSQGKSYSLQH